MFSDTCRQVLELRPGENHHNWVFTIPNYDDNIWLFYKSELPRFMNKLSTFIYIKLYEKILFKRVYCMEGDK